MTMFSSEDFDTKEIIKKCLFNVKILIFNLVYVKMF